MDKIVIPKKILFFIVLLSAYLTLITFFFPIKLPCIFKGSECPTRYGFPVPVYITMEGIIESPYKNYLALPENFAFWFIVILLFWVLVRVGLGIVVKIKDES